MKDKRELFICECHDLEHSFVISRIKDKEIGNELIIEIHLNKLSWYRRIWIGIKYIFGRKSKFGNYEEVIINKSDKKRLLKAIKKL